MRNHYIIKYDSESMLLYGIVMTMAYPAYSTLLYSFFGQTEVLRTLLISMVLLIDAFAITVNHRKASILVFIVLIFGGLFSFTYFMYPNNRWVIDSFLIDTVKYVMLAFFVAVAHHDIIYDAFKAGSILIFLCCLTEPFTKFIVAEANGYMVYGMRLLLPTVLFGYYYLQEKKKKYLLLMLVGILLILFFGNRSSILNAALVFILQIVFFNPPKNKAIRTLEIIALVFIVFVLFMSNALSIIGEWLESLGVSSRTIEIMTSGFDSMTDDNGRSIIWENCRTAISQKPWTGYGIGGDRNLMLLGKNYVSRVGGVYAHNIIYELLLDFGVIIGSLLLAFIVIMSLRLMMQKEKNKIVILFSALTVCAFIKLMFSGSVWNELDTFLCLGLAINCYRNRKLQKNEL